jgi:hypothetical protein
VDLAAALRSALPADLAAALRSASLADDGTLVVTTASPVWAARLRFHGETLLATCRARHPAVARVRIRVGGGTEAGAIRPR